MLGNFGTSASRHAPTTGEPFADGIYGELLVTRTLCKPNGHINSIGRDSLYSVGSANTITCTRCLTRLANAAKQ